MKRKPILLGFRKTELQQSPHCLSGKTGASKHRYYHKVLQRVRKSRTCLTPSVDAPLIPKDCLWGQFPKGNAIVRMEFPLLHNCRGVGGVCGRHFPSSCLQPSSVQLCGKLRPDTSNPTTGGSSSPPAHANSGAQMQLWRFPSLVQWGASLLGMCETGVQFSNGEAKGLVWGRVVQAAESKPAA